MLITSLSQEERKLANKEYTALHSYYKAEFRQLEATIQKRITKVKLLGLYEGYFEDRGILNPLYIRNLAEGLRWKDYEVFYAPSDCREIMPGILKDMGPKLIIIGPGRVQSTIFFNMGKTEEIILASQYCGYTHFDNSFSDHTNLRKVMMIGDIYTDIDNADSMNIFSMNNTFQACTSLEEVVILGCRFNGLNDFKRTFIGCSKLNKIYIENFRSDKLYTIHSCFENCESIKALDLSMLNTTEVADFTRVFYGCTNLKFLEISTWVVNRARTFYQLFCECRSLEKVNIRNWKINKEADKTHMFNGCDNLKSTGILALDIKLKTNRIIKG